MDVKPGETEVVKLLNDKQMLTGVEPAYGLGSLSLSPDGSTALMVRQQTFGAQVYTRAFDLDFGARRARLSELKTIRALVDEACRVAKFQTGSNELDRDERQIWFGDKNVPQPCAGIEAEAAQSSVKQ